MKEYDLLRILSKKIIEKSYTENKQYNMATLLADKKGNILSIGFNSYIKTHPRQLYYNKNINDTKIFLHSEIDALTKCRGIPYYMIVCRIGKLNQMLLAKPCIGCYKAIKEVGIKKVYYTNKFGELVLLDNSIKLEDYHYEGNFA